jgi:hypothetical protein
MLGRRDRFSGNILLYDYLLKNRAPVLLHRNLKQAFRIHEHLVNYGNTDNYLASDSSLRHKWQPPSWDLLDTMIAKEKAAGSFVLEVHGVQMLDDQRTARSGRDNDPAKKVMTLMRLKSTIRVSVIPSLSDIQTAVMVQEAILNGTNKNVNRYASVETKPILIEPKDLAGNSGQITDNESYRMMVSLTFADTSGSEELHRFLGLDTSNTPCYLSTHYGNILECPQGKTLLRLKAATKNHGIGLEVSMYWNDNGSGSVLENCNRHLKKKTQQPRSYPTPPLDSEPRYRITFVYGTESLERSKLVCLHCARNFSDVLDFKMHLITWHDYFLYKATEEGIDEYGMKHWRFESEVADHKEDQRQRASAHADEPYDVRVVAPARPFDRRKYLQGDDGYQRVARLERPSKNPRAKAVVDGPVKAPIQRHRKPPDQVQARPQRNKKIYLVPRAPSGITFFRSFSKRPLRQGEAISESDDELDEGWMHLRKHTEIDKEDLPEAAARFIKFFDNFMHEESLHSDTHAGDAIIRFSQSQAARICEEGVFDEFKKKMDELLEDNVITKEVHDGALDIVTARKSNTTDSNELSQRLAELDVQHEGAALGPAGHRANKGPQSKKDRKGKGKAMVTDTGHLTPITADSDGDVDMKNSSLQEPPDPPNTLSTETGDSAFDLCNCGEDASATPGSSGIIACSSIVSFTALFSLSHMSND